ncbi:hypothetical protein Tco_0002761 [Tanacetum coccineum]
MGLLWIRLSYMEKLRKKKKRLKSRSKEKEDPEAFVIPIQIEAKFDLNALVDTGSDINAKWKLGRDEAKKVNQGITRTYESFEGCSVPTKTSLNTEESDNDDEEDYGIQRNCFGAPMYGPKPAKYLIVNESGFLGSLPVPLQHMEWKPDYKGNFCKKEEGDGQWHAEIRLTDPYGNVYDQGFKTKPTKRKLSKYHKLSDVMSPNWFPE